MRSLRVLVMLLGCVALSACELVADFDRGKLDAGKAVDSGAAAVVPEQPDDAEDAGQLDAGGEE